MNEAHPTPPNQPDIRWSRLEKALAAKEVPGSRERNLQKQPCQKKQPPWHVGEVGAREQSIAFDPSLDQIHPVESAHTPDPYQSMRIPAKHQKKIPFVNAYVLAASKVKI